MSTTAQLYVAASGDPRWPSDMITGAFVVFVCRPEGGPVRRPARWRLHGGHGQSGAAGSQFWRLRLPVTGNRRYVRMNLIQHEPRKGVSVVNPATFRMYLPPHLMLAPLLLTFFRLVYLGGPSFFFN